MNRSEAIREIKDVNRPLDKRVAALRTLRDLIDGESDFANAVDALLEASQDAEPEVHETARATLDLINQNRYSSARKAFIQELEQDLQGEDYADPKHLFEILNDSNASWKRRRAACRFLGLLAPPHAMEALLHVFSQDAPDLAFEAANALFTIRGHLGRPLVEATRVLGEDYRATSETRIREAILYALGLLGDVESHSLLAAVLDDEAAEAILRRRAADALAMGPPSEIMHAALHRGLSDADDYVRDVAVRSIAIDSFLGAERG